MNEEAKTVLVVDH